MTTLLVITVGQTDVQFVGDGSRQEFDKWKCAALHDELERRWDDWSFVDPPVAKVKSKLDELPAGAFQICTPKLDAVLKHKHIGDVQELSVLILETRRDADAERGEPRLAGAILVHRLEALGCQRVTRDAFLTGHERMEDRDSPPDAVLRRALVKRIDDAVRRSLREVGPDRLVVATTGGFPRVNALVDEVVRLHAGTATVDLIEIADGTKTSPPTPDRAISRRWIPEPAESYQARRHALEMIERGDLLGAWGAVQHLHNDEVGQQWTQVVKWLSLFATSQPLPEECDIDVLKHEKMAIHAALRVEFALRAGDIPRAVHGTVAFFEAALWDHLYPHLQRHEDSKKRRLFTVLPAPAAKLIRTGNGSEDQGKPFKVVEEGWYQVFDDNVCAIRIAKHYLQRDALTTLGQTVAKVRDLRNDVAHNVPTPELMATARRRMEETGLWAEPSCIPQFLGQTVIVNEMADYGIGRPKELCDDLIATVRARLLAATR